MADAVTHDGPLVSNETKSTQSLQVHLRNSSIEVLFDGKVISATVVTSTMSSNTDEVVIDLEAQVDSVRNAPVLPSDLSHPDGSIHSAGTVDSPDPTPEPSFLESASPYLVEMLLRLYLNEARWSFGAVAAAIAIPLPCETWEDAVRYIPVMACLRHEYNMLGHNALKLSPDERAQFAEGIKQSAQKTLDGLVMR